MLIEKIKRLTESEKLRKFVIYGSGQVINLVSPLLVIPYIFKIVGEDGLGKVGTGMNLAFILIVLVDYSSYVRSVKEVSIHRDDKLKLAEIIATVYLSKAFLILAVSACFAIICFTIPYFSSERTLFFYSFFIVIGQFINPSWFLQGIEDFKTISALNIISKVIYVAGVFFFINTSADYIYVNLWLGVGVLLPAGFVLAYLMVKYKVGKSSFVVRKAILLIRQDFSFCISQLLFSFRQYSPIMIVGIIGGHALAGQYKIMEQIVMLFRTYFQTVFKFSLPIVSYELSQDEGKGMRTWKLINGYNLLASIVMLMALYFGEDYVFLFFKVKAEYLETYRQLLHVAIFIPVFIGITLAQEQLMFSFDKNKDYIKITFFITLFSSVLFTVLFSIYGLKAAFFALLVSEIVLILIYHNRLKNSYFKTSVSNAPETTV
jgi:O-antigen/teichoic acid export membrane protein